jgi:hypothetical protein
MPSRNRPLKNRFVIANRLRCGLQQLCAFAPLRELSWRAAGAPVLNVDPPKDERENRRFFPVPAD